LVEKICNGSYLYHFKILFKRGSSTIGWYSFITIYSSGLSLVALRAKYAYLLASTTKWVESLI
jgi:hypothetical protein